VSGSQIAILSGPVGMGKTTVAERVVGLAHRQGMVVGGLLAPAMKNCCGQKVGIWGVDILKQERRILACTDRDLGGPAVGHYSFESEALVWALSVLEAALSPDMLPATDLIVVDEIGKLELWRGSGLAPILPRLAAGEAKRALVLVRDFLLSELQASLGSVEQMLFNVSQEAREALPARIAQRLMGSASPNSAGAGL
jgi:nucleoside-triphosphatase THEP1